VKQRDLTTENDSQRNLKKRGMTTLGASLKKEVDGKTLISQHSQQIRSPVRYSSIKEVCNSEVKIVSIGS
jgi:hypothetical protein